MTLTYPIFLEPAYLLAVAVAFGVGFAIGGAFALSTLRKSNIGDEG